ncbi:MAG: hypothetical protein CMI60_23070 [Parvibaculum sp.]|nr:hypothetical protein [Parvibaculum sp.]|tara:strand:- start:938 stop:1444 length:507 start_codon:yes stop_codon:yes gene_type:complete
MGAALPYVSFAIKAVGAIKEHNAINAAARQQERYNQSLRRNADAALMWDTQLIEAEKSDAKYKKESVKRDKKRDAMIEEAKALNMGFGNADKIAQTIFSDLGTDMERVNFEYMKDLRKNYAQFDQAVARRDRVYNTTKSKPKSSIFNLGLAIGGAAAESAYMHHEMSN